MRAKLLRSDRNKNYVLSREFLCAHTVVLERDSDGRLGRLPDPKLALVCA